MLRDNSRLCVDPTYPKNYIIHFPACNQSEVYSDIKETILPFAPEGLGKAIDLSMFVDSDHAGNDHT